MTEFNAQHRVGTAVRYWPGVQAGDGTVSVTRSEAWLLGGHTPVVMVKGYSGAIALTHVLTFAEQGQGRGEPCEHDTLGCGWREPHDPHTKAGDGRPCCGWPPRCSPSERGQDRG